jgi:hypothetical protein
LHSSTEDGKGRQHLHRLAKISQANIAISATAVYQPLASIARALNSTMQYDEQFYATCYPVSVYYFLNHAESHGNPT